MIKKKNKKIFNQWNSKEIDEKLFNKMPILVQEIKLADKNNTNAETLKFASEPDKIYEILLITDEVIGEIHSFLENYSKITEDIGIWGDLFLEIEEAIVYFDKLLETDREIMSPYYREFMNSFYYHKQMAHYIYINSILDKMTTLIYWHLITTNSQNKEVIEKEIEIKEKTKIYFHLHFKKLAIFMVKKEQEQEFNEFMDLLINSELWKILKSERNNWTHNFSHPMVPHNIGLHLLLIYTLIIRLWAEIKYTFISSNHDLGARTLIYYTWEN